MIVISKLKEKDVGMWVWYRRDGSVSDKGRIKSWSKTYIYVVYNCDNNWAKFKDYTAEATSPEYLFRVRR